MDYIEMSKVFKALSDPKRLEIVSMLSSQELCGCKLLERFNITQPTLSHDMKVLCDANIVKCRRDGKRTYYRLVDETINSIRDFLKEEFV